jgi:hypothetical protein
MSSTDTSHHDIINLWFRQTHRHATIILLLVWFRQRHLHAIIILWVRQAHLDIIILWARQTHLDIIILWVYAPQFGPQTKILEVRTNRPERHFSTFLIPNLVLTSGNALFNVSYPKSSTHDPEKWFENTFRTVCSDFQNLRLGSIEFGMRWGSSCEFDRVGPTHHHDIIILWVRHSIIILIVRETHHFVISTDTSSWHHHLVS